MSDIYALLPALVEDLIFCACCLSYSVASDDPTDAVASIDRAKNEHEPVAKKARELAFPSASSHTKKQKMLLPIEAEPDAQSLTGVAPCAQEASEHKKLCSSIAALPIELGIAHSNVEGPDGWSAIYQSESMLAALCQPRVQCQQVAIDAFVYGRHCVVCNRMGPDLKPCRVASGIGAAPNTMTVRNDPKR